MTASSAADADMQACADPNRSRIGLGVAGQIVGDLERGVVVGQCGVAVGEPFGVVERGDAGAAGLAHRAEEALGLVLRRCR